MAKIALRTTSDRKKREVVTTGDTEIYTELLIGNKKLKQIHFQVYSDGYAYIRIYGQLGLGGKCEQVIHLGYIA